jgi:hypothetical protein
MGASIFFPAAMTRALFQQWRISMYTCWRVVARTWISYWCVPCHPRCTHRTTLVVNKLLQFSCGCEQFH